MSYEKYSQRLDHIINVVADAGFKGIEPEVCMLGPYLDDPAKLAADLDENGLELGALCLVCDWLSSRETKEETAEADRIIGILKQHFPDAILALCQMPQADRDNLQDRQSNCISCCNAIGRRASNSGIRTVFHPNSPEGSVFRTAEDYGILIEGLDSSLVGFAPDAGHIARGGMDPVSVFEDYISVIRHVHFKDMSEDGTWVKMGSGCIDFTGIVRVLEQYAYKGWGMVEDESSGAELDPDAFTRDNAEYMKAQLYWGK